MNYPGFQRIFFLMDTDGSRRSRVNEAQNADYWKKMVWMNGRESEIEDRGSGIGDR